MKELLREKIIEAVKKSGLVDAKRLKDVLDEAVNKKGVSLIATLTESRVISERDLMMLLSMEMGIPPIDLSKLKLEAKFIELIPEKLAQRYSVVPLSKVGKIITIAIADPTDILVIDDIKSMTGCDDVQIVLAAKSDINKVLNSFYQKTSDNEDITAIIEKDSETDVEVVGKTEGLDVIEVKKESTAAPIVKMVDLMIHEGIVKRASDIHIEPQERSLRVRYRIDGKLYTVFDLPKKNQNAILARLKIMSKLDITETRVPQDGRFRVRMEGKEIDFRVSSLPACFGNKIVMRALDKSSLSIGLDALGFLPATIADFKQALSRPFGIILVTGPTGSGKSTTLYSILNEMNIPDRNIVTIEDPVEYQVAGMTQIPVYSDIGFGFAEGLRAILRQSPDIIMVGEIRDFVTADIAIKSSLTGQMVLSTLHTNDSVGAITRLINMGIAPFLVSSSLVMACAQRLLRKICMSCREETIVPEDILKEIRAKYPEAKGAKVFYKGKGCAQCNNTGYKGRIGTIETLLVDDAIKRMINERSSETDIREYLAKKGVKTLRDNAMMKFIDGVTTLEEVLTVT